MKPPRKVTVGAHTVHVDRSTSTGRLLRDENSVGDSRPDHLLIRLDVSRPGSAVAETLLHELLHILWNRHTALKCDYDDEQEERVIAALSPSLLDTLRRNPKLVDYLLDG